MIEHYELSVTKYSCGRCSMPIDVPSEAFYWFSGPEDPNFWCSNCQDLPQAKILGTPAEALPARLDLPKGFVLQAVPRNVNPDELSWKLYRPYSKRSFLRQYMDWLNAAGQSSCTWSSTASVFPKFDPGRQQYSKEIDCEVADICNGVPCQFLHSRLQKPEKPACSIIALLCDTKGSFGPCQTGDEAMLLQWFLLLTGSSHWPMLIPQPSILSGKRRPDFVCFVPISKFQYQKVVVLVDRPGKASAAVDAETKDYEDEGFTILRIIIDESASYFKLARDLKTRLERI